MDGVQELLGSRRIPVMDSILVTRELLGAGPRPLGEAKSIVLCSPSRSVERRQHQDLVNVLVEVLDELVGES
ncbi:hypothetical protein OG462_03285 [Streptomyces sp. NBC_01077]|uniref:hypothetical protein n=1 Tax=Streptomyces sp. NBC_01077 TaxID=2903746 RepID=UPI003863B445|nr:hypothetical protein OG462_03285 [Streptomyces sp. NBC_01077]